MKKENKFILSLVGVMTVIAICFLGLSFNARMLLVDTIGSESIDSAVAVRMMDPIFQESGIQDTEQLLEIQTYIEENEAIKEITGKYLDEITASIAEGKELSEIDISGELDQLMEGAIEYIETNEATLGSEEAAILTEKLQTEKEEIKEIMGSYANMIYEDQMSNQQPDNNFANQMMKLYVVLNGVPFRIIMSAIILLFFLLTLRLTATIGKGFLSIGIENMIAGGIFILVLKELGIRLMMTLTNRYLGRTLSLDGQPLLITGLVFAGAGIVFLILGLIFHGLEKRRIS